MYITIKSNLKGIVDKTSKHFVSDPSLRRNIKSCLLLKDKDKTISS